MAIINCPECHKEISDKAKICPSCGYELNVITVNVEKNKTTLGEKQRNLGLGLFCLIFGIACIALGIPLIPIIIGIFVLIGGLILVGYGIRKLSWSHKGKCPYCGTEIEVLEKASSFKCSKCNKLSVHKGNYMEVV